MGALRRRNRILIDALEGQSDDEQVMLFLCSMLINWYVCVCARVRVCPRACVCVCKKPNVLLFEYFLLFE